MRHVVTALILGAVFGGSVLNQFHLPWWQRIVARFDRIVFLPYWAFFAPNPGFAGADTFTYQADDGTDASAPATVTITVQ